MEVVLCVSWWALVLMATMYFFAAHSRREYGWCAFWALHLIFDTAFAISSTVELFSP